MDAAILQTLRYFLQFGYAPTATEIYTFLSTKTSKSGFYEHLEKMIKKKKAVKYTREIIDSQMEIGKTKFDLSPDVYTLGEYSIQVKSLSKKVENSLKKLNKIYNYIKVLGHFSQIQLVGISGSVAMMNADEQADVDLFIITSKNRLWTGRLIALLLASLMGIKRGRLEQCAQNKVCPNLFFDEQNLTLPIVKRGEYGAHEVLQMKPITIKNNCYRRFLDANKWVFALFPNAKQEVYKRDKNTSENRKVSASVFGDVLEKILRIVQLHFINLHKTTEIITDTQLWFHPDDYSKKVKWSHL